MAMGDVVQVSWGDVLKTEGILCNGYGLLPKYAMLDRDLSLMAKTIYAYLCSLAGSGETTYPSRDTILAHLKINKETYYTHFKQLTEGGYVSVQKSTSSVGRFAHNIYRLESNPKKFAEAAPTKNGGAVISKLSCQGIKSAGYGFIPRSVMFDSRLGAKAKGLYAYFSSYSGAGNVSFPKQKDLLFHLKIACNTYYSYLNELTSLNYLSISQRHIDGKLSVNDYYLVDNPDELASSTPQDFLLKKAVSFSDGHKKKNTPPPLKRDTHQVLKKPDTDETTGGEDVYQLLKNPDMDITVAGDELHQVLKKQDTVKQDMVFQDTAQQPMVKQDMSQQDTENQDTISNNSSINNFSNINPIYPAPVDASRPLSKEPSSAHWIDMMDRKTQREYIKEALGYDDFPITGIPRSLEQVNNLIEIVLSSIREKKPFIRVNGQNIERGEVIDQLLSLEYCHYEYVLDAVEQTMSHIKNIRAYYLTALYNAPSTYEAYIMRAVQEDFAEDFAKGVI